MANRFSLEADIRPTVDDRAAEQEVQDLARTFEDELGDLNVGVGDDIGGVGGLGGAAGGIGGGGAGGGGGLATGGAAAAGRGASLAGASATGLTKVALGGVVGFGLLKGIQTIAGSSPAFQQSASILSNAMDLFFRPFGNFLGEGLRPLSNALLDTAVGLNKNINSDGLVVGGIQSLLERVDTLDRDLAKVIIRTNARNLENLFGENEFFTTLKDFEWDDAVGILDWSTYVDGFGDAIDAEWPGWPNVRGEWMGWPDVGLPDGFWPSLSADSVLSDTFGSVALTGDDIIDEVLGDSTGGDVLPGLRRPPGGLGGGGGGGSGGVGGQATIDSIADDIQRAIRQASSGGGGGGGGGTTGNAQQELQTMIAELRRVRRSIEAIDLSVDIDAGELDPF